MKISYEFAKDIGLIPQVEYSEMTHSNKRKLLARGVSYKEIEKQAFDELQQEIDDSFICDEELLLCDFTDNEINKAIYYE